MRAWRHIYLKVVVALGAAATASGAAHAEPVQSVASVAPEAPGASGVPVDLSVAAWRPVTFSGIPPTVYRNDAPGVLTMAVDSSASFLLRAFSAPLTVTRVRWRWRHQGSMQAHSAAAERRKGGDDMLLRVGLLLAGPAPLVPLFAPAWMRAVRDYLSLSADRIVYLVVGTAQPEGAQWLSPYSDSIAYEAVASQPWTPGPSGAAGLALSDRSTATAPGAATAPAAAAAPAAAPAGSFGPWQAAHAAFAARSVVGLWLMADGDDTGSRFITQISDLWID